MSSSSHILAIDQGTTSSRAILFDEQMHSIAIAQQEFTQIYPQNGWVEHDPEEIWKSVLKVCREVLEKARQQGIRVAAIGITNQRETTLVWERKTGKPIYNAIVWQDRRTADLCTQLKTAGHEKRVAETTGLLLDPYFSASKLQWILDHVAGAREKAAAGELAFGTIDSFLLWRLTGGRSHATDATNASRTMLFNIHQQQWDNHLLELFNIPASILPEVKDCATDFGFTDTGLFETSLPITGIAGDQQSAAIGQACLDPGMIKSTYGTGCFVLLNTGTQAVRSENRLLTTVAYRKDGQIHYAIEGSIFIAGAAVQWLRDGIKLIDSAAQTEPLAAGLTSNRGLYLVPAFTGLGAPYWDPHARGAIFGITRDTGIAEIVRATLEAIGYQTRDLMLAMARDAGQQPTSLRVDGGMVANDWLMQFLADILDIPVERPEVTETTALGAAYLAGLQIGLFPSFDKIRQHWRREKEFRPQMDEDTRQQLTQGWDKAVARVREPEQ
ncbi:MAG: glycerol kinase GlpK [Desulfuromonadales bacterium]|nr:glycerol kinase GlpK [Desulfuromonadales bacterium]